MLKENKKTLIIASIVTVIPVLIGLLFWNQLPDTMATHFGADGDANGFSSKAFAVFGIPLICLALLWIAALITAHDPKKQNINPKVYSFILWIIPVVSIIVAVVIYPINLGHQINIMVVVGTFLSVLFIIVGNFLPKTRQNHTIGIRVSWALANEKNWNKTHRMSGYLWMVVGIVMLVLTLCGVMTPWLQIICIAILIIIPTVYSFWLHKSCGL